MNKSLLAFSVMLCLADTEPVEASQSESSQYATTRMRNAGISEELIALAEKVFSPHMRDTLIQINIFGFLKRVDYSVQFDSTTVRKCRNFAKKHGPTLQRAEITYGVPAEILTALLWVESKLGALKGTNNVVGVYYSLIQADHPEVQENMLKALKSKVPAEYESSKQQALDRSKEKAQWALGQLQVLDKLFRSRTKILADLKGSFSGAFGFPQFIPSSYAQWAKAADGKSPPNLYKIDDAIHSVANYLKINGWKKDSPDSHREALLHYNKSEGYVAVIQKIATSMNRKRDP